jgi:hypothetical protein
VNWKLWRHRLTIVAMSLFVTWHAIAIVIGPAPDGSAAPVAALHTFFRPYLTLFRLESPWTFFTNIIRLPQFRYVITDADGNQHTFRPVDDLKWYHPRSNWFERTYWAILDSTSPTDIGDYIVPTLCRRHADLKPVAITYLLAQPVEFWPEESIAGGNPFDDQHVTVEELLRADCPNG